MEKNTLSQSEELEEKTAVPATGEPEEGTDAAETEQTEPLAEEDVDEYAALEAEVEASKKRPGKYRYQLKQSDVQQAVAGLEKAKGRYQLYRRVSILMLVLALLPCFSFIVLPRDDPQKYFAMLAALTMAALGIWIKGITGRVARGAIKNMNPRGVRFSVEVKKHGLSVSDNVNPVQLLPFSFFSKAYDYEDFLSLVTVKNSALHIKKDESSASYRAIAARMKEELGDHYIVKSVANVK